MLAPLEIFQGGIFYPNIEEKQEMEIKYEERNAIKKGI